MKNNRNWWNKGRPGLESRPTVPVFGPDVLFGWDGERSEIRRIDGREYSRKMGERKQ